MNSRVIGLPKRFENCGFKNFDAYNEALKNAVELCINFYKELTNKKSLLISGSVGNGKTHLAIAILRNLRPILMLQGQYRRAVAMFMVADEFFMALNDAIAEKKSKLSLMKEWLSNYDMFCLDDLGIRNMTEAKLENLYTFINCAYLEEKRIIITTNFRLDDLEKLDERIPSRLVEMAEIITLNVTDYRLRK